MRATPDSERLVDQSLGRIFRVLERMRFIGVAILGTLAILFAVHGEPAWKTILATSAVALLLLVTVRGVRRPRETYRPSEVVALLASILGAQLLVITLTGGIRSPFLVVAAPVVLGLAIGTSSGRWLKATFAVLVAVILVLGLGDILGWWAPETLVPAALTRHDDELARGYATAAMLAITTITLVAGVVGSYLRKTVQGAVHEAIAARAETLDAMRARHRELEALSGALAHELKNPLASIRGLAVLLARKLPEPSQEAERMTVLLGEVQRMGQILDEFLNFSRPAEGLATSVVPVDGLVAEVRALHEGEAAQREVRLKTEVKTAATLTADPRKLKQVLVNLIQNALEASPPGATVLVGVREQGADVVFEVVDEGPGLDAAIADRLFVVGATTKPSGSGLGLVIARGIAEQHGGWLTLAARRDRSGCVASLGVPRAAQATSEGAAR